MKRLLAVLLALLASAGIGMLVLTQGSPAAASTPKFDNSTDTVHCGSFSGKVSITPALVVGGTTPTTITVKGTLNGCTDGTGKVSGSSTSDTDFTGKVTGTLTGTNNNLTSLVGCSSATGSLTVTWKADYFNSALTPSLEKLAFTKTTTSLKQIFGTTFTPGTPFNTDNMTTPGYGGFEIGAAATGNGCAAPTYTSPGHVTRHTRHPRRSGDQSDRHRVGVEPRSGRLLRRLTYRSGLSTLFRSGYKGGAPSPALVAPSTCSNPQGKPRLVPPDVRITRGEGDRYHDGLIEHVPPQKTPAHQAALPSDEGGERRSTSSSVPSFPPSLLGYAQ
jgi:hypothetical protein